MVWLERLRVLQYSEETVFNRLKALHRFADWCEARGMANAADVTRPVVERYQRWLYNYRQRNGRALASSSQSHHLTSIRQFYRWLQRENLVPSNPAYDLELPRAETRLPRVILSSQEAERVMQQPDLSTPLGQRDRAILETLYSTAMRRNELVNLKLYDMDRSRGVVLIRLGKGKKDRMVPIGERALKWVERYLDDVRPNLVVTPDPSAVFLTASGSPLTASAVTVLVSDHIAKAELGKAGACHVLRHTAATLMLENGADIRFIQALLGHATLSTTQVYTHVSIAKLKEIHAATHPAAKLAAKPAATETPAG